MEFWTFGSQFILLLSVILMAQALETTNSCRADDLTALNGFYNSVASPISGWDMSSSACCFWTGVTCDGNNTAAQQRVVSLDLSSQRLSGSISESLVGLGQLRVLNVSLNNFNGLFPPKLFQMQNLEVLDLSMNYFSGSLPFTIQMPRIKILNISHNNLVGPVTRSLCDGSTYIESLSIAENDFYGEVPLDSLNCTSLQQLYLNGNNLSGSLFKLRHLRWLQIQHNSFLGPLDETISELVSIIEIDISYNLFSGDLPDVFNCLKNRERFLAASNQFSGRIPSSLSSSPSISVLDLDNNKLTGGMDINRSSMLNLTFLNLGSNLLHGPIPESLSSCRRLNVLNFPRNNVTGVLPHSFQNLQELTTLSFSRTGLHNLTRTLLILQYCRNLSVLIFSGTFWGEDMLESVNLKFMSLKVLVASNCQLKGSVPAWLRGSKDLQFLDLSWNRLSGTIPSWLGEFKFLFYMDLSNNTFFGNIPESLTDLQNYKERIISPKDILSSVPLYLSTQTGKSLRYNDVWDFPSTLDLSHNVLNGPIWPHFGNLKNLQVLNLGCNKLSGAIPDSLSMMEWLEKLNLSHNVLSGHIPQSLTQLHFLSSFDASYNELSGLVPSDGQFSTFPDSSFNGNIDLCRPYLGVACQSEHHSINSSWPSRLTHESTCLQLAFDLGAAFGFIVAVNFCFLSGWVLEDGWSKSNKRRRHQMQTYVFRLTG